MVRRAVSAVLSWQWAGPVCAYVLVALLVGLFVDNTAARFSAQDSLSTARGLATNRITLLTQRIDHLSRQLAHASKERGRLLAKIEALTAQLRQLGVTPVVISGRQPRVAPTPMPAASPSLPASTPTPRPHPSPSPTRTVIIRRTHTARPHPSSSPSSRHVCVLKVCV